MRDKTATPEVTKARVTEVANFLPIPQSKSKEFWSRWKIDHVRRMATTGRATNEPFVPPSERTKRTLDRIFLKEGARRLASHAEADTTVRLARGSPMVLSAPLYLGDMSFGALSGVPNIAIARAADETGVFAGTGEGGLLKEIAECERISVQWASARFGVDISSLMKGQAVVIKIGQGAKPGIGGHLPGVKVTKPISETRRIPVGQDAISPAPHHDIYSIEDLGQRILALKEATGKPIFVKVGATNYIPYIASGIARMGAAGVIIDGAGAGTGAAPSIIKNNVGIPVELAVASTDAILKREGLREGFTIVGAGRVSTPEDSLKLIALGADIVSLGTAALMALGCLMVHKCHLGYCPAILTNKISPNQVRVLSLNQSVVWLSNMVRGWTEEMKVLMQYMGVSGLNELRGRRDLLQYSSLNEESLEILGLDPASKVHASHGPAGGSGPAVGGAAFWTLPRVAELAEVAGTVGKSAGEPVISSMGTTGPPFVEEPVRICDWMVLDGAQVTRPSIDPYREEIETSTYIGGISLRLSSPFFFTHLPAGIPDKVASIFERTALSMGLLFDESESGVHDARYAERVATGLKDRSRVVVLPFGSKMVEEYYQAMLEDMRSSGSILLLRTPSSGAAMDEVVKQINSLHHFAGIVVDEDEKGSDLPLEMSVSRLDRALKRIGRRHSFALLAESNSVRGSDDVFKIVALGADCVGLGKAALLAIGFEEGESEVVFDSKKSAERLENFVVALQKEVKLLAGAAGVSSVASSLVGNRELLRTVDMEPGMRKELGVKPAGAA